MKSTPMPLSFTTKEGEPGEPCSVILKERLVTFNLREPATLDHAQAVATFLGDNIANVELPTIQWKIVDPNDPTLR